MGCYMLLFDACLCALAYFHAIFLLLEHNITKIIQLCRLFFSCKYYKKKFMFLVNKRLICYKG